MALVVFQLSYTCTMYSVIIVLCLEFFFAEVCAVILESLESLTLLKITTISLETVFFKPEIYC